MVLLGPSGFRQLAPGTYFHHGGCGAPHVRGSSDACTGTNTADPGTSSFGSAFGYFFGSGFRSATVT